MSDVEFRRCLPEHIAYIVAQDAQAEEHRLALLANCEHVANSTVAISGWVGLRCVGACGILDLYPGRAFGWALLSPYAAPHLRQITRHTRFVLDSYPARRIEMVVPPDFAPGHRWARLLGFECETPNGLKAYFQDGGDAIMYARIKPWHSSAQ